VLAVVEVIAQAPAHDAPLVIPASWR
jgi:hypothetical protein